MSYRTNLCRRCNQEFSSGTVTFFLSHHNHLLRLSRSCCRGCCCRSSCCRFRGCRCCRCCCWCCAGCFVCTAMSTEYACGREFAELVADEVLSTVSRNPWLTVVYGNSSSCHCRNDCGAAGICFNHLPVC